MSRSLPMSTSLPALAFAGIGLMGLPMTQRLLAVGYPLSVWNRSPDKCAPLQALGAQVMASPAQLCARADIVMLCLANTEVVREVVFGPCGMHWVDAPVSGGTPGAANGTLAIMAGGRVEDIERVRPILAHLGQRLTRMGDVGAGQVTKVCNQMIVACNALVIAEVVALAEQAGVDTSLIAPALAGGFADSKPLQILAPQMAESQFEPVKWHVRTLLKDLDTSVKLSQQVGSATPLSGLAAQLMRQHGSQGNLERDPATLVQLYRAQQPQEPQS